MKLSQTTANILMISAIFVGLSFLLSVLFDGINFEPQIGLLVLFVYVINQFLIKLGWIDEPEHPERQYATDPFTKFTFTDSLLLIGNYEIEKSKVKKVVLDSVQTMRGKQQGLVQLPFNQQKGQIPELWFNKQHLEDLKKYILAHVPEAKFIK